MKRRLLPILMTLVLVCALPIWAAFVTSGDVTNPLVCTAGATLPDLQAKIDAAADNATITLNSNTEIAAALKITKNLTIDLNGCVLRMTGNTSVFYVYNNATLTIQDSSAAKSGTITGGNAGDGGGVYIGGNSSEEGEGHLVMTGGTITGCATDLSRGAGRGGGVFVFKGSFTMSGTAKITNCTADWGGGVVVHTRSSTFTMNGGEISDCKASNTGGGVCLIGGAGFEMTGGTIRNCTDGSVESSAIYMDPGTMKAHGGTVEGNVWVVSSSITRDSEKNYTIFNGTITFEGNGNTTAMYPVKFDLDQGSDNDITVRETKLGDPAEKPADPTKPNLVFQYWYEAGTDGSAAWDFSTPVTRPLHLLAKWEEKPQTGGYYYAPPAEQPIEAPKTADPGAALYGALALLSLTGMVALNGKKR